MSLAIRAVDVSKRYRLDPSGDRARSWKVALERWLAASWRPAAPGVVADVWALRDVSFEVRRGEVVGIIGPNGAGKSTLLRILSRVVPPTAGRIEIAGRAACLLELGAGFQPELTGRENIELSGTLLGMTRAEIRQRFDDIVAFAEIGGFVDVPVKRYSSGMWLRLAFAISAHVETEILFIDEALAVGDAAFQARCLTRLGDAAAAGRTVVFVSHDTSLVERLADRALWLDGGRVAAYGPVQAVVPQYLARMFPVGAETTAPAR